MVTFSGCGGESGDLKTREICEVVKMFYILIEVVVTWQLYLGIKFITLYTLNLAFFFADKLHLNKISQTAKYFFFDLALIPGKKRTGKKKGDIHTYAHIHTYIYIHLSSDLVFT